MNLLSSFLPKAPPSPGMRDPVEVVAGSLHPSERPGFRWMCGYAKAKVQVDPLYRTALEMIPPVAKVLDLGCGVGLIGLLLQARGWNNECFGIEWDPAKARFAKELAKGAPAIQVTCGNLLRESWPACSVIAALDVIHYLTQGQQRDLIQKFGTHLPEGGRIILRVMNKEASGVARITRLSERMAIWIGWNRAERACWQSLDGICFDLMAAGFSVMSPVRPLGLALGNHLLVGVKRS